MVEDLHLVEPAADLLRDGLAPLSRAPGPRRVEPGLEQPDEQPGHRHVEGEHPLDVALAEGDPGLPQVLGVGAQHHDLAPGQVGVEDQGVEAVVLDPALPQRGQRVLEQRLDRPGRRHRARGDHRELAGDRLVPGRADAGAAQAEVIDPERRRGRPGELVGMLVDHVHAHVLEPRQHVGERDGRPDPVDGEPRHAVPVAGRGLAADIPLGLPQVERAGPAGGQQALHPDQVVHRVRGGHVGLVGLRDRARERGEQRAARCVTQLARRLGGEVLLPRSRRGDDLGLQVAGVHVGQRDAGPGPDHHQQPGQRGLPHRGAVLDGLPVQRLTQDLLGAQPDRGGVAVPGQVHHAGHEPAVDVLAQEQPGPRVGPQVQHPEGDRGQLVRGDLEQLLPRVGLQDLGQVLAVVAVRPGAAALQHLGQLAAQHRDPGDALVVGLVGEQAEEAVFADHLAGLVDPLDRDVVEVTGPVHGGPGVGLGEDEALRVLGPGPHLRRQRRERGGAALVVPQDAKPGAGDRHQRHALLPLHQVVLAVPEEGEVVVGEPAQQRLGLGGRPGALGFQPVGEAQRRLGHLRVVLHRHPHVEQHPLQVLLQLGQGHARGGVDLDVRPRLGDLVVLVPGVPQRPDHFPQRAGDVPADQELRVDDVEAVQPVPGELHRHRVDEERHVVGDDVDGAARLLQRRAHAPRAHPHQGAALRALGRHPGVLGRHPGHPGRPGVEEFLGRHLPVVGAEEVAHVADSAAVLLGRLRCQLGGLVQQAGYVRCFRHLVPQSAHRPATGGPAAPTAAGSSAAALSYAGTVPRSSRRYPISSRSAVPPSARAVPARARPARRG